MRVGGLAPLATTCKSNTVLHTLGGDRLQAKRSNLQRKGLRYILIRRPSELVKISNLRFSIIAKKINSADAWRLCNSILNRMGFHSADNVTVKRVDFQEDEAQADVHVVTEYTFNFKNSVTECLSD